MSRKIKDKILFKISPTYKKVYQIFELLTESKNDNIVYDSGEDAVKIDDEMVSCRHYTYDWQNIANIIDPLKKNLFIDIGANHGQSARYGYSFFNNIQVVSYEPLKSCIPYLEKVKTRYPGYIYKNVAMSSNKEPIIINEVDGISGLSSSLKIRDDYFYFGKKFKQDIKHSYEVESTTLNEEIYYWKTFDSDIRILKIDTQGTELDILMGNGNKTGLMEHASFIDIIKIEIMVVQKYVGQSSYLNLLSYLDKCGFVIFNITPIYRECKGEYVRAESFEYGWATEYDFTFINKHSMSKLNI